MNYIYTLKVKQLTWLAVKRFQKILPTSEQQRLKNYRLERDKIRLIVGKLLLLYALKKQANYDADVLPRFTYNQYKKPNIEGIQGGFNISHAGDWVICGYNTLGDIGLDIERIMPINVSDYHSILTANEYQCAQQDEAFDFFLLWTLKEAIMKADGRGFFLLPHSFDIPKPFKNNAQIKIGQMIWFLYSCYIDNHHRLAIASETAIENNIQIEQVVISENGSMPLIPI